MSSFSDRVHALAVSGELVLALNAVPAARGGAGHAMISCPRPEHEDRNPSCSVHLETGQAHCFGCGWSAGDVVALHRELNGHLSMGDALRDLETRSGAVSPKFSWTSSIAKRRTGRRKHPKGRPEAVATWTYFEADGTPAFDVVRRQFRLPDGSWEMKAGSSKPRKDFVQTHPGGTPRGLPARYTSGHLRPLYQLPVLLGTDPDLPVYVVEGERAADALRSLGAAATTSSGGASNAHHTDWSPLGGRRVVVWPDNDQPGLGFAADVVTRLANLTSPSFISTVRVDELDLPAGGDAVDWLAKQRRPLVASVAFVAGSGGAGQ